MRDHDVVLGVLDDDGLRGWLRGVFDETLRLEDVSRADISRILRMLEATNAHIAMVEVDEAGLNQALAIIMAISTARPWVTVVAVCRAPHQEMLLQCMRAGARDCLSAGTDMAEVRERLRRHQLVRPPALSAQTSVSNLIIVAGADSLVDTGFFTQNLAVSMAARVRGQRTLAIDAVPRGNGLFYLDARTDFGLENLLANPESLDEKLIDTALDEFRPGLRLLHGGIDRARISGDRAADLFIALNRLMSVFDVVLINAGGPGQCSWIHHLGIHARQLILLATPEVHQIQALRTVVNDWKPHLSAVAEISLVLDGHETGITPTDDEITELCNVAVTAKLPMDWRHRLEAMNLGLPMCEQAARSGYCRQLEALVDRITGTRLSGSLLDRIRGSVTRRQTSVLRESRE
ncbi:MAG: hypothetical protein C0462_03935 [Alcanivorax sp.]|nr:hypothetical protein [Alcanivorax sp.]